MPMRGPLGHEQCWAWAAARPCLAPLPRDLLGALAAEESVAAASAKQGGCATPAEDNIAASLAVYFSVSAKTP